MRPPSVPLAATWLPDSIVTSFPALRMMLPPAPRTTESALMVPLFRTRPA